MGVTLLLLLTWMSTADLAVQLASDAEYIWCDSILEYRRAVWITLDSSMSLLSWVSHSYCQV